MVRPDPRVLITCTQPRADALVHDLKQSDIHALASPALSVNPVISQRPKDIFDAMLVTSRHALNADLPLDIPVIAIGEETALQCQHHGLRVIQTGDDNLKSMDLSSYHSILYPCAKQPSHIPPNATPWIVYETIPNPAFIIPENIEMICVFSAKAALIIKEKCRPDHKILCLSQPIADIFTEQKIDNLAVCDRPRYDAMKDLILK